MPTAAAISMSGRESRDVVAEIVSGIDVPRLDRSGRPRPHVYEIVPIVAADNRPERRGATKQLAGVRDGHLLLNEQEKLHFTKRSGNSLPAFS